MQWRRQATGLPLWTESACGARALVNRGMARAGAVHAAQRRSGVGHRMRAHPEHPKAVLEAIPEPHHVHVVVGPRRNRRDVRRRERRDERRERLRRRVLGGGGLALHKSHERLVLPELWARVRREEVPHRVKRRRTRVRERNSRRGRSIAISALAEGIGN